MLWPEFFSCALENSEFSDDWVKRYSIGTFYHSTIDDIAAINIDNCLTDYISDSADYLALTDPDIDKLIKGFKQLNVSFTMINFEKANKELFDEVYQNSLYEINFQFLALVLIKVYNFNNVNDIHHKNYTLVMSQPDSPLANYVNSHISNYIDTILSGCNGSIMDDEAMVLSILNNRYISNEQKEEYIDLLQTPITSLTDVENEDFWLSLLDKDLAVCSAENIISYFTSGKMLDKYLIDFINRSDTELNFTNIDIEAEQRQKIFTTFVSCNDLLNEKYKKIVYQLHITYQSPFDIKDISKDKFEILVDGKIIHMDPESLKSIRKNYPEHLQYYIEGNINEYAEIMTKNIFILDEIMPILPVDIDDEIKIKLLTFVKAPLAISDKKYSTAVNDYILENNFKLDEISNLASSYEEWPTSTQRLILNHIIHHISTLTTQYNSMPEALLKDLFVTEQLDNEKKIDLLIAHILHRTLSKAIYNEYFTLMNLPEFSKTLGQGEPKIEINKINQKLLTALKNKHLFDDFKEDTEEQGYYVIIKR